MGFQKGKVNGSTPGLEKQAWRKGVGAGFSGQGGGQSRAAKRERTGKLDSGLDQVQG
jgi:hypothetical protein